MPYTHRLRQISAKISKFNGQIGAGVSWLVLAMVLVIIYDVGMRYLFRIGSVGLQELEWHLFSVLFLLAAAAVLKDDGHVSVDVIYKSRRISDRTRTWINLLGSLFLLLPFCLMILHSAWPYVLSSFLILEGSPDPGGLPYRFLLKLMIPLGFFLLLLQGIAVAIDNTLVLLGASRENASDAKDVTDAKGAGDDNCDGKGKG